MMFWIIFMLLFSIGIIGIILNRSNIIIILMSIEVILLAIIYVFLLDIKGSLFNQVFVIMILTVAAAEAAIGLAILVAYFRIVGSIAIKSLCLLYGLLTVFPREPVRKEIIEFVPICALFLFCVFLSVVLFGVSYWLGEKMPNKEKVSAYECGFNPINNMGQPFSIRFFLIGVLFLVFDLEVSFLYPWSVSLQKNLLWQYVLLLLFLVILIIGLFYEWIKGGLEWE